MRHNTQLTKAALFCAILIFSISTCFAQATRTWVSGVGDDANPCSRTAPCKTFAGAISKTAAGGAINVIDPGGFGAVTITKSITIEAVGPEAGVLVSGTNGIIINAGVNDVVSLRGIQFDGVNTGLNGISFNAGAKLIVEHCTIRGFSQNGILFQPSGTAQLVVGDTMISGSAGAGISVIAGSSGAANVTLTRTKLVQNVSGLAVQKGAVTVNDSLITGSSNTGVNGIGGFGLTNAKISLNNTTVSDCTGTAITSFGSNSSIFLSNVTVFNNNVGLNANGGSITSFGTNRFLGNTSTGSPTLTVTQQ